MKNNSNKTEFIDRFVKKDSKELSFTLNLYRYRLERKIIEKKLDYDPLEEWGISIETQEPIQIEENGFYIDNNIMDWYPSPVHVLHEDWIDKYKVDKIIKSFQKQYNFSEIINNFVLINEESKYAVIVERKSMSGGIFQYISNEFIDKEYKSFRNNVIIPLMVKEFYHIVRKPMRAMFYDLKGYFQGLIHIKEPDLEIKYNYHR